MIVVDSSAVVARLAGVPHIAALDARLDADLDWHAPHLLDVEYHSVLRRLISSGELGLDCANDARADFSDVTLVRYPHAVFSERVWELRDNLHIADAYFVALAEALDVPLITLDARVRRAPQHGAECEVYAP